MYSNANDYVGCMMKYKQGGEGTSALLSLRLLKVKVKAKSKKAKAKAKAKVEMR